uniref:Uncharacterized protein n=1 Tax=Panagrolaimus sp. ES5 TaxID=591445 RepID=A0AC34FRF9_9BILA
MKSPTGNPDSSPSSGSSVTSFNKNLFVVVGSGFGVVVVVDARVVERLVEKILRVVVFDDFVVGIVRVEEVEEEEEILRVDVVDGFVVGILRVEEVEVIVEEEILRGFGVPTSIQRLSSACGPFDAIRIDFVVVLSIFFGGHGLVIVDFIDVVVIVVVVGGGDTVVVEVVVVEDDKIFDIGDVNSSKNVRGVGGDVVKAEGKMGEKNPPERILDLSGNFGAGTRRP